ncbi:MAG: PAS domain S-box protein [Nitrospira sp.]|nr:PAS domain S-box protein [Nitrospira sp.]
MPQKTIKKTSSAKRKAPRRARSANTTSRSSSIPSVEEELFPKAFRLSPHPIGITELETGRCLEVNAACLEIFGFRRDEVVGQTTLMLGIWPDPQEWVRLIDRLKAEGKVRNLEVSMRTKDGGLRRFLISTDLITLKGKRCLLTIGNDITERKQAEEAWHQSEERWQLTATGTTDGIWDWDVAGHTVFLSPRWKQLRSYHEEEIGVDETEWLSRIHPEDFSRVMTTVQSYFKKEIPTFHCEYRTRRKDGTYFWISDRGIAVWDAQGRVVRMVGSETDITERKQAEETLHRLNETLEQRIMTRTAELKETNERLQAEITERKQAELLLAAEKRVLELIAIGAALPEVLDTLTRETEAQSTEGMLCSVLLADEEGQRLLHGAAPSLAEAYNAAIHGIAIGPKVGSCGTAAFERKPVFVSDIAGDSRWAAFKDLAATHGLGACHSTPILSSQGRLLGTIAMYYRRPHNPGAHDRQLIERATQLAAIVIERKRADEALRASEELFRIFLNNALNVAFVKGCDGRYLYVNRRFEEAFQLEEDEALGKRDAELFPRNQAEQFQCNDRSVLDAGEAMEFEETACYADGLHTSIVVKFPVRDGSGQIYAIGGFVTDITDRKRTELALQQNQLVLQEKRQELQMLTEKLLTAQDSERQRIARDLHDDFGQRLVALTLDVAALERQPPLSPESLGKTLEPVRKELAQLSDDLRRLAHRLHPSLLKHAGLRVALEDYIQQAMKRTGLSITLKVGDLPDSLPLDLATCLFRVCQESLQNVAKHANATKVLVKLSGSSKGIGLSVTDNGTGFAVRDKSSHQKGLGLTSMQERLRLMNGFLNIHSRPADGTKVCAWIPFQE